MLLANVFEKFRNNSLKHYELCPSHYFSASGLNWDVMLNVKKLRLNLFQMQTCIYLLRNVLKVDILIFLRDIRKPTITI